jgi:hypothetical protein
VGAVIAPIAVTLFAVASDAIQPRHFFGSPVLYALMALSWFVWLPLYAMLSSWLGLSVARFLIVAVAGMCVAWLLLAMKWGGIPPLNPRSVLWIVGHPLVAVLTFWVVLRIALRRT